VNVEKFLALLFIIAVSVTASILTFIYGWGLQPKSWTWIIGVGFFVQVFLYMVRDRIK